MRRDRRWERGHGDRVSDFSICFLAALGLPEPYPGQSVPGEQSWKGRHSLSGLPGSGRRTPEATVPYAVDCKKGDSNDRFLPPRLRAISSASCKTCQGTSRIGSSARQEPGAFKPDSLPTAPVSMAQKRYNAAPKSRGTPTAGRGFDLPCARSPQRWARQLAPRARVTSPPACGVFLSRLAFIPAASSSSARPSCGAAPAPSVDLAFFLYKRA
jgi:hypothetical protein